eukprot:gene17003-22502_t
MFSFFNKPKKTSKSIKLLPGSQFPDIVLRFVDGNETSLKANGGVKLIIFYRGQFCTFSTSKLDNLQQNQQKLSDESISLIAVSADPVDVSKVLVGKQGYTFPIACGLTVDQMKSLGLYITDPTNITEQSYCFSEPAYVLLNEDNSIKYIDIASHPIGSAVDVDTIIGLYKWEISNVIEHPEFKNVLWGSKNS